MWLYDEFKNARNVAEIEGIINAWHTGTLHTNQLAHPLRSHQIKAISQLQHYETYLQASHGERYLLFHMATGSGKTMLMASALLYYYGLGYRRFVFVSHLNILLDKTKDVLCNPDSNKYLFAKPLRHKGQTLTLHPTTSLQTSTDSDIYICFKTIHALQDELNQDKARENANHAQTFAQDKTLFLVDEVHHFTDCTNAQEKRWRGVLEGEHTLHQEGLLNLHPDNRILGFSATLREDNTTFQDKYAKRVLAHYPFKTYRADGYTKEPELLALPRTPDERILLACLNSLYRQVVAAPSLNVVGCMPKVLVKFPNKATADAYHTSFETTLKQATTDQLTQLVADLPNGLPIKANLSHLLDKFDGASLLKQAFAPYAQRVAIIHSTAHNKEDTIVKLNRMDDPDTPLRMVFAVDMVNEGWDVLSLFDIVRFAESSNAKKDVVTADVQLIGRGARYYPFALKSYESDRRKSQQGALFPQFEGLETLTYFTDADNKYLAKLKAEAQEQLGGMNEATPPVECVSTLQPAFKLSKVWSDGLLIGNKVKDFVPLSQAELEERLRGIKPTALQAHFDEASQGFIYSPDNDLTLTQVRYVATHWGVETHQGDLSTPRGQYWLSALCDVMDELPYFRGRTLFSKVTFCNREAFAQCCLLATLPHVEWVNYSLEDKPLATVLKDVKAYCEGKLLPLVKRAIERNMGCDELTSELIHQRLAKVLKGDKLIQKLANPPQASAFEPNSFFVFDKFYGNKLEQDAIDRIGAVVDTLKQHYDEVYLLRNAGFLKLYGENGQGFEPDFLLFTYKQTTPTFHCVFIEPKDSERALAQAWKETLLQETFHEKVFKHHKMLAIDFVTDATLNKLGHNIKALLIP